MEHDERNLEGYINKSVTFTYSGARLTFYLSQGVFSSHSLDEGSKLLLKTIAQQVDLPEVPSVLDVGCGVGTLGISLAARHPRGRFELVDRSVLAWALAQLNGAANKLTRVECYGSLGLERAGGPYDLIVSNFPAKAGQPVIEDFLRRAGGYLTPTGRVAVVFVEPLEDVVEATLSEMDATVYHRESTANHAVFHYFGGAAADPDQFASYVRHRGRAEFSGFSYDIGTVYGLPEFDTLSFRSELLLDAVSREAKGRSMVVVNPGQGHVACAVAARYAVESCRLFSDDLLQLSATRRNLEQNKVNAVEVTEIAHLGDLAAHLPKERSGVSVVSFDPVPSSDWVPDTVSALDALARCSRQVVFASSSTTCHRVERAIGSSSWLSITNSKKYRGQRVLHLRARGS